MPSISAHSVAHAVPVFIKQLGLKKDFDLEAFVLIDRHLDAFRRQQERRFLEMQLAGGSHVRKTTA